MLTRLKLNQKELLKHIKCSLSWTLKHATYTCIVTYVEINKQYICAVMYVDLEQELTCSHLHGF
jgi:hypothetical protein